MPSLCVMETVSGSSLFMPASPNSLDAHRCSIMACIETCTAGSAILSFSVKSRIPLMFGLRVFSCSGRKLNPEAALTWPLVLSQMMARPGRSEADEIDAAGEQRIVHHVAGAEGGPGHLDVAQAFRPRLLFDHLLVFHDHHLQVAQPVLLGDADFVRLGVRGHDGQPQRWKQSSRTGMERRFIVCLRLDSKSSPDRGPHVH